MNTDTIAPEDGLQSLKMRLQIARQKGARPGITAQEARDVAVEIAWLRSRIALASVGRRGEQ